MVNDKIWQPIKTAPKNGVEIELLIKLNWPKMSLDKNEPRIGQGWYSAGAYWWDEKSQVWRNRVGQWIDKNRVGYWKPCLIDLEVL